MDKINQVIKPMRWKAIFYMSKSKDNLQETYGLKTLNCSPPKKKKLKQWYRFKKIYGI